ncbi:MAG: TIGR03000 domain-containing protein [Gemmataceae bacterium]
MISAIVMAALIGSSSTPDFFFCSKAYGCGAHCAPKCAPVVYSCCGCTGSVYSCYGCSGCTGCLGCYGSYYSCMGCSGCYGCMGSSSYIIESSVIKGGATKGAVETVPATKGTPGKGQVSTGLKARVIVELPQDAKLVVDGTETLSSGARREFSTPVLEAGQNYFYELTAVVEVDGKPQTMTKKVVVRAGEESVARYESTGVAQAQE